jgi:hypothetical protein
MRKVKEVKKSPGKDYSKVALMVIQSLRHRATLFKLDAQLDLMARESDPSHPRHRLYLALREDIDKVQEQRSLVNEELSDKYGIDVL